MGSARQGKAPRRPKVWRSKSQLKGRGRRVQARMLWDQAETLVQPARFEFEQTFKVL